MARLSRYKQWDGGTRMRMLRMAREAEKQGALPAHRRTPGPCEICGQTFNTMWHAEEYGPTFEAYVESWKSLCGQCHAMLHLRFRFPNRWHAYKDERRKTPAPPVRSMSVVYRKADRWDGDIPHPGTKYAQTDHWWDTLTCVRYEDDEEQRT